MLCLATIDFADLFSSFGAVPVQPVVNFSQSPLPTTFRRLSSLDKLLFSRSLLGYPLEIGLELA